jgi:hypothetical protein
MRPIALRNARVSNFQGGPSTTTVNAFGIECVPPQPFLQVAGGYMLPSGSDYQERVRFRNETDPGINQIEES